VQTPEEAKRHAATLSLKGVASRIACPLFVVAGNLDRVVPWEHAHPLAREASGPVEFLLVEDGNHVVNNRIYSDRPHSADWMAEKLGARLT
jgi:2,6-dihydroxypseudooxynicotine hydrolase